MTLLELLEQERVAEFNEQRGRRSTPDLFAADLAGRNLQGVDLSGANLEKADLSSADLSNALLVRANLNGADLTGACLDGVVAVRSKWREAYLDQVDLSRADFSDSDLSDVVLNGSKGPSAIFRKCRLTAAEAKGVHFEEADFGEARLDKADFSKSKLSGCRFSEANLAGASFEDCGMVGADLRGARAANTCFRSASLGGARLERADLTAASLVDADLSGASLVEADLAEAELAGAILRDADLTRARLDSTARRGLGQQADAPSYPDVPETVRIEDPHAAILGTDIAILWENEDDERTLVNRCAVLARGDGFAGRAPAIPAPAELVLSRGIVVCGEGFASVCMLERPSGTEFQVTRLSTSGEIVDSSSFRLGYDPVVAPIVTGGAQVHVYGLGRRGPTLYCHRIADELERVFAARASTARALLGNEHPVLSTRGGVIHPIGPRGLEDPLQEPSQFAVRVAASCRAGDRTVVAWLAEGHGGLRWAELVQDARPTSVTLDGDHAVAALDLVAVDGKPVVVYSREQPDGRCGAWACVLGEGDKPIPLVVEPLFDIDSIQVVGVVGGRLTLACTTLAEDLLLVELDRGRAQVRAVLP
ncbi:MAG TPA: pentapeptide repeat-containing protein [Myxococcota bacterium]|nr:pentapeptide repeat-containing protein [Myxococcota bacterium]